MNAIALVLAFAFPDMGFEVSAPVAMGFESPACPCGITGCDCPAGECECLKDGSYYLTAAWCVHCRGTDPHIETENRRGANITVVDFDVSKKLAESLGVTALPALVVVKDGKVRRRQGGQSLSAVRDFYGTPLPGAKPAGVALASQGAPVGFTASDIPAVEPGARVTHIDGVPVEELLPKAKPVRQERRMTKSEGYHAHVCRSCGFEWWHNGGDHNCDRCGAVTTTIARWAP